MYHPCAWDTAGRGDAEKRTMTFTVDIHHHLIPDFYRRATEHDGQSVGGVLPAPWSQASALSSIDDAGIDVAIASISAPGVHLGDDAEALALARRCNDFLAEIVRSRPDRFGGFAILPLPDVDAALDELARALDQLGLDGVVLLTNTQGDYLGDPLYRPLFDELQRRAAVVLIHPTLSPDASAHASAFPIHCSTFRSTRRALWRTCIQGAGRSFSEHDGRG
jgi:6-methylsalicylate decarboxylase